MDPDKRRPIEQILDEAHTGDRKYHGRHRRADQSDPNGEPDEQQPAAADQP